MSSMYGNMGEDGWNATTSEYVPELHVYGDGSVGLTDTGETYYLFQNPSAPTAPTASTVYTTPPAINADLQGDVSSGFTLRFHGSNEVWKFAPQSGGDSSDDYLASDTDHNGNALTYTYSYGPVLSSVTDTQGRTITFHESSRLLYSVTDSTGREIQFGYNSYGQLDSYTDAAGKVTSFGYTSNSPFSFLADINDPNDDNTYIAYSSTISGAVSSIKYGNGTSDPAVQSFTYYPGSAASPSSGYTTETSPDGNALGSGYQTKFYYNASNQITKTTDGDNDNRSSSYDANGDVVTATDGMSPGNVAHATFDSTAGYRQTQSQPPATTSGNTAATTSFTYNSYVTPYGSGSYENYLPTSSTDPQSNCTSYSYDSSGNLLESSAGQSGSCAGHTAGQNTINTYDPGTGTGCALNATGVHHKGDLCSSEDPRGNTTEYGYDANGNLLEVEQPGGSCVTGSGRKLCTSYTYDSLSRISTVTDGNGNVSTYTYNSLDEVTDVAYSDGTSVSYSYDADGNLTSRTGAAGPEFYTYNPFNQLTVDSAYQQAVNADAPQGFWRLGETSGSTAYDSSGNANNGTYSSSGITYGYTPAITGDPTTSIDVTGGYATVPETSGLQNNGSFSDEFWISDVTDASYYPQIMGQGGWTISENPSGDILYTRNGNRYTSTTALPSGSGFAQVVVTYNGSTLSFFINGQAAGTDSVTFPTNSATTTLYIGAGASGTTYATVNGGLADAAVYNKALSTATVAAQYEQGTTGNAYTYDPDGNMTSLQDIGGTVGYGYDNADHNCWVLEGSTSTTTCNSTNNANTTVTGPRGAITMTYNNDGQRATTTFPSGVVETDTYNGASELASAKAVDGSTTLMNFNYSWASGTNDSSLPQGYTENDSTTTTGQLYAAYGYNAQNEVCFFYDTTTAFPGGSCASPPSGSKWAYDQDGNICSTTSTTTCSSSWVYNTANEITADPYGSFTYDNAGDEETGPGSVSFSYNAKDQATTINGASSSYADTDETYQTAQGSTAIYDNALGIGTTETAGAYTFYTRDANGNLLTERVGTTSGGTTTNYNYLLELNSTVLGLTTSSGTLTDWYHYNPYGSFSATVGSVANPFDFDSGWVTQQGSGSTDTILKFGTRFYDPIAGQLSGTAHWTQPDPAHQGFNFYEYAADEPDDIVDGSGQDIFSDVLSGTSALFSGAAAVLDATGIGAPAGLAFGAVSDIFSAANTAYSCAALSGAECADAAVTTGVDIASFGVGALGVDGASAFAAGFDLGSFGAGFF